MATHHFIRVLQKTLVPGLVLGIAILCKRFYLYASASSDELTALVCWVGAHESWLRYPSLEWCV